MRLGVCYYPEHWDEARWAADAAAMAAMGLSRVRVGEFAWSRLEAEPGRYDWGWLDRAVAVLGAAGLEVILGTPTATPPKWLVDAMPDMLAADATGRRRGFGSRRHYCFSHEGYARACDRIVEAMARRYGGNAHVVAWQTDNEFGCHHTTLSYSPAALAAFRTWLAARYGDVGALNAAWGTVFWSQEYRSFDEVELPAGTVTEPNPAHVMDFRRFSSDQVARFNARQAAILRTHSPGRDITHNFMGFTTDFDHWEVARDLDVAAWDSYPLGFLDTFPMFTAAEKLRHARTGHPDISAFHHDLYRGVGRGRWWVMEQQPGPVNWARWNPAPTPGAVRMWTLEAMAHGAELVSYFRWRQFPRAQEAMHAGLHRVDGAEAPAADEVRAAAADIAALGAVARGRGDAALVFDYAAAWALETQPQGADFRYLDLVFAFYSALRRAGLSVDVVAPGAALDGHAMAVVPSLPMLDEAAVDALAGVRAVLVGPRTGSKTAGFAIPDALPPGPLQRLIGVKVARVESLRDGLVERGDGFAVRRWLEHVESALAPEVALADGRGVAWRQGGVRYLGCWPDAALLDGLVARMCAEAGVARRPPPADVRVTRAGDVCFAFNFGPDVVDIGRLVDGELVLGDAMLGPAGVAAWRVQPRCASSAR